MFKKFLDFLRADWTQPEEHHEVGKWKETTVDSQPKEEGVCLDAKISRVLDGDTVEVTICMPLRIRLLGVDVAEKNTELGQAGKKFVEQFTGEVCKIYVPLNSKNILDATQLGRVLGQIWINGKNLSDLVQEFKK